MPISLYAGSAGESLKGGYAYEKLLCLLLAAVMLFTCAFTAVSFAEETVEETEPAPTAEEGQDGLSGLLGLFGGLLSGLGGLLSLFGGLLGGDETDWSEDAGTEDEGDGDTEEIIAVFSDTFWNSEDGLTTLKSVYADGRYRVTVREGENELSYLCEADADHWDQLTAVGTDDAAVFTCAENGNLIWRRADGSEVVFIRYIDPLDFTRWYSDGKELTIYWLGEDGYQVYIDQPNASWSYECVLDGEADELIGLGAKYGEEGELYADSLASFAFRDARSQLVWTDEKDPEALEGLTFEAISKAFTQDFWEGEDGESVFMYWMDGYYSVNIRLNDQEYGYLCVYDRDQGTLTAVDPDSIDFDSLSMEIEHDAYASTATFVLEDDDHMVWHDDSGVTGDGIVLVRIQW